MNKPRCCRQASARLGPGGNAGEGAGRGGRGAVTGVSSGGQSEGDAGITRMGRVTTSEKDTWSVVASANDSCDCCHDGGGSAAAVVKKLAFAGQKMAFEPYSRW